MGMLLAFSELSSDHQPIIQYVDAIKTYDVAI